MVPPVNRIQFLLGDLHIVGGAACDRVSVDLAGHVGKSNANLGCANPQPLRQPKRRAPASQLGLAQLTVLAAATVDPGQDHAAVPSALAVDAGLNSYHRFSGISSPHSMQWLRLSPAGRRDRAASTPSVIVSSI